MKIKNIRIKNVRGISDWTLTDSITRNKPHLLVAPNGFGKTSVAKAFKSATDHTSLKINDADRYLHDESKKAHLSFDYDDGNSTNNYYVNESVGSNEIRKNFDILVISDLRVVKAHAKNMGKFSAAKGKLIIPSIEICPVVRKPNNPYKITEIKASFGKQGRMLKNLEQDVFNLESFALRAGELQNYLSRLKMKRLWSRLESIQVTINSFQGDEKSLNQVISGESTKLSENNPDYASALKFIEETTDLKKSDAFLTIWQLTELSRRYSSEFQNYLNWIHYDCLKKSIKNGASDLSKAWKKISVKETKGKLVLNMPEPDFISNGQIDVLVLFSLLHIARYRLQKNRAIIVVDEVFDYLDDANLTVAQYYLTQLIDEFKKNGKELYLLILTHLNPAFFQNYTFSNQKIIYLDERTAQKPVKAMKKLIGARDKDHTPKNLKDKIAKYLVHYHAAEVDFSHELNDIKDCRSSWGRPGKFHEFLEEEFYKFKDGDDCDPLAICAITRRSIEHLAYRQISEHQGSDEFFEVHKTAPKLKWASKQGAKIPEFHFLLRIIFDDGLHWSESRNNLIPIISKLCNPIIRTLIIEAVDASLQSMRMDDKGVSSPSSIQA